MSFQITKIRKFQFVDTDSKVYEVILSRTDVDSATGIARQIGVSSETASVSTFYSTPSYDTTEQTFVVVSAKVAKVFHADTPVALLCTGAFYDASSEGAGGAALATLLS